MLFNSIDFAIFLPIVFFFYWFLVNKNLKLQNFLIVVASYFFYGLWDWRFLSLILSSTIVDYLVGIGIHNSSESRKKQKLLLWISILFNISLLGFFKYCNFFIDSFVDLLELFGFAFESTYTLKIILPVGISFYTFQTMSYSLDIYFKRVKPTKDFVAFATFVAFFPQLVAGPIERASNLLNQITTKRVFRYEQVVQGLKLILWGLFKKIAIADSLAPMVDDIFANYNSYPSSTLIFGTILFSFQIYGDFSGYSDIAIGTSKLFGIELMSNFKFPYFSRNIAEFWRRWHISLSTWFRDYVYIPLGGSRTTKTNSIRNIFLIFLISGFWHGANWTFIVWGAIHAVLFVPFFLSGRNRDYVNTDFGDGGFSKTLIESAKVVLTFFIVSFTWIFFRSDSITVAFEFVKQIITNFNYVPYYHPLGYRMIDYFVLIALFVLYEYRIRRDERAPFKFNSKLIRFLVYTVVVFLILLFYDDHIDRSFIYFQF